MWFTTWWLGSRGKCPGRKRGEIGRERERETEIERLSDRKGKGEGEREGERKPRQSLHVCHDPVLEMTQACCQGIPFSSSSQSPSLTQSKRRDTDTTSQWRRANITLQAEHVGRNTCCTSLWPSLTHTVCQMQVTPYLN